MCGFHCVNVWFCDKQSSCNDVMCCKVVAAGIIQPTVAMAARAILAVEQVLDELDNDEELSEGSEDEFDGYLEESGMMGLKRMKRLVVGVQREVTWMLRMRWMLRMI